MIRFSDSVEHRESQRVMAARVAGAWPEPVLPTLATCFVCRLRHRVRRVVDTAKLFASLAFSPEEF